MKINFRYCLIAFVLFSLVSCQTVTISPKGRSHVYSNYPDFERSYPFFLFGLAGEHYVNVQKICRDKAVKQMQTQKTFLDGFLGGLTLGIYTPKTARVWCEEKSLDTEKSMETEI